MPIKDPEERRRKQREQKREKRARERVARAAGQSEEVTRPGLSATKVDLAQLAERIKIDTDNLSVMGWLKLRGSISLEIIALAREALRAVQINNVREIIALLKFGSDTLSDVIAATGSIGDTEPIPADEQHLHEALLADPVALEASQLLVEYHSRLVRQIDE